ncbi:MAG: TaqI-like C-terminal specificity domain-containing protein, partial [Chthoniobacter sp.]|uniref:Eco57I restriction-modification methylase domain-containing protein n=1 Tax=Chthoniobacter sp. TaxID=2510640 RepID=UPI0032A261F9
ETADLSAVYDDKKRKAEKVSGLIRILNRYKFTIVENTPIDQEIALDPELLGKVFENLLASYNEETKTTARKLTGSFYTPRPIVDNMVDGSLKAHLTRVLVEKTRMKEPDARAGLDLLFAYTEKEHTFTPAEVACLIAAIDALKILDPACGSGAFPMGVLHKLVYILGKLDPDNDRWKQTQLAKLDSAPMREQLEAAFADNADDYGRKLYLIENCLYGVDIQPIAIQITKLRFFISLVCDQKTNRNKKDNHGILPLPNLETKFVAADTLIGLPIPEPDLFVKALIEPIEKEIEAAYHSHFAIQRRDQKLALQKKIKSLRQKLADTLINELGAKKNSEITKKAQHVAAWDPFDPQASADFFDPHWMFGRSLADGFDIVIGNPPYVFGGNIGISAKDKKRYKDLYVSGAGKTNLFVIFIERGAQLLGDKGLLSYILPNTLLRVTSYDPTRRLILNKYRIEEILDLDVGVFDQVTASTIAIRIRASAPEAEWKTIIRHGLEDSSEKRCKQADWKIKGGIIDIFSTERDREILDLIEMGSKPLGDLCHRIRFGVVISGNLPEVVSNERHGSRWKPFLEGDEIGPYSINYRGRFLNYDESLLHRSRTPDVFECRKIMIQRITGGQTPLKAALDDDWFYNKESILNLILNEPHTDMYGFILALINSKTANWFYRKRFTNDSKLTVNLSKEYVGQIPVKTPAADKLLLFEHLARLIMYAKRTNQPVAGRFLEDLIDACVMECYFREHMAERDLLFQDTVAPHLTACNPAASDAQRLDFLTHVHATLNAPSHPVRNRLIRLSADSPDLLAIIKQEGRV